MGPAATKREITLNINKAIDTVAERFGNTRTVCKNYYVHPDLITAYQDGRIAPASKALPPKKNRRSRPVAALRRDEVAILQFLNDLA
jgi:DNA topoisomerase-1